MTNTVGVISSGLSNLGSLLGAFDRIGANYRIVENFKHFSEVNRIVLPGVGSFSSAMSALQQRDLIRPLEDFFASGKPMLGICLGMQVFCDEGTEGSAAKGLGFVRGRIALLAKSQEAKLPHIGWNSVNIVRDHPVLSGVDSGSDFYFVHSYAVSEFSGDDALATTTHASAFLSGLARSNLVGFQFHPEKSQKTGRRILENFMTWDGLC